MFLKLGQAGMVCCVGENSSFRVVMGEVPYGGGDEEGVDFWLRCSEELRSSVESEEETDYILYKDSGWETVYSGVSR